MDSAMKNDRIVALLERNPDPDWQPFAKAGIRLLWTKSQSRNRPNLLTIDGVDGKSQDEICGLLEQEILRGDDPILRALSHDVSWLHNGRG